MRRALQGAGDRWRSCSSAEKGQSASRAARGRWPLFVGKQWQFLRAHVVVFSSESTHSSIWSCTPDSGALCTPQVTVVALPEQPAAHVPGTPPHPAKEQGVAGACCPT